MTLDPLLTPKEACAYLNVSKSWLYAAVDKGTLPSVRLGKLLRFRREDLLRWTEEQAKQSTAKEGAQV